MKAIFCCDTLALTKFVRRSTVIFGLVVLCSHNKSILLVQNQKMYTVAVNCHKKMVNRHSNFVFAGPVVLQKSH